MNRLTDQILVSAHAIQQFQRRIAPMDDAKALEFILAGIQLSENVSVQPDGRSVRVRTRRPFPFEFRAYCVFDEECGHFVVTTIVRGDSNVKRKRRRKDGQAKTSPRKEAD